MHETPTPTPIQAGAEQSELESMVNTRKAELGILRNDLRDKSAKEYLYEERIASLTVQLENFRTQDQLYADLTWFTQEHAKVKDENDMLRSRIGELDAEINEIETKLHMAIRASRKVEPDTPDAGLPNLTNLDW